jgi:hypothetical protein
MVIKELRMIKKRTVAIAVLALQRAATSSNSHQCKKGQNGRKQLSINHGWALELDSYLKRGHVHTPVKTIKPTELCAHIICLDHTKLTYLHIVTELICYTN